MHIIIPAYKPDMRLIQLITDIHEKTDFGIIVVNDGSGEAFDEVFAAVPEYCTLLRHEVNQGKGRAMKTAFAYLLKNGADNAVIVDADGQHTPEDAMRIAAEMEKYPGELVLGCRTFGKDIPFRSRFGNKLTIAVFAAASGKKVSDTQTGLRGIPMDVLEFFTTIPGERYEYEMNMLLYTVERGIGIREIPIETIYIDNNSSSHFNVIRDSLKIYAVIFKFVASSMASFLIDYILLLVLQAIFLGSLGAENALAVATVGARIVSSICNFIFNKKLVFKDEQNLISTLGKYYLVAALILGLKYIALYLLTIVGSMHLAFANILAELALYALSYTLQRVFVFKNKRK
ncbi:MAG: glycosyltransferase [Clostridiales bacterium]|nr:glycosyltransferase [Clostridiales bacterium]